MIRKAVLALALVGLLTAPAATQESGGSSALPPEELVAMLRHSRIALMRGERDEALRLLRQASRTFPQDPVPIMVLWEHHRKFDLPEHEVQSLRELLTRRLADPTSPLPPGTLVYLVNNPNAGEEELELILGAALQRTKIEQTEDLQILEAIGVLQVRLGHLEDARRTFGRLAQLNPSLPVLWRVYVLDFELERWADAAGTLARLRELSGIPYGLQLAHIQILGKLGRYESLVQEVDRLLAEQGPAQVLRDSWLPGLLLEAAWDLHDAGKGDDAEAMFRRLLELDSDNTTARKAILYLYSSEEERQRHEAAILEQRQQETDPTRLAEEGADLLAAGDVAAAFELLERAAPQLPDSELVWFNLGLAAIRLERWEVAERAYGRAIAINPNRWESRLQRGIALEELDRCKEAVRLLDRVLRARPDMTQAHYYLYACHTKLGNAVEAVEHLRLYNESR